MAHSPSFGLGTAQSGKDIFARKTSRILQRFSDDHIMYFALRVIIMQNTLGGASLDVDLILAPLHFLYV